MGEGFFPILFKGDEFPEPMEGSFWLNFPARLSILGLRREEPEFARFSSSPYP
jgi:hypothetical protein